MNTFGNLGGLIGPLVVGWAVDRHHSWILPFHITAIVYAAGAVAWLAIDPRRPIVPASTDLPRGRPEPDATARLPVVRPKRAASVGP